MIEFHSLRKLFTVLLLQSLFILIPLHGSDGASNFRFPDFQITRHLGLLNDIGNIGMYLRLADESPRRNYEASKPALNLPRPPFAIPEIYTTIRDTILGRTSAEETSMDKSLISHDPEKVRFLLYDNSFNPDSYTELKIGDVRLVKSTFLNSRKPIKFLIHGFRQNSEGEFPQKAKNAYLQYTDYNVICVDWGPLAKPRARLESLLYPLAADNVPRVGEKVADFIMFLRSKDLISSLSLVHIVGFSLGAHIAGVAGNQVYQKTAGFRIGRITGLDPAGPQFLTNNVDRRLDENDASFVDVIHTNEGQLGHIARLGQVDFYPNGGTHQPSCVETDEGSVKFISSLNKALTGSCSHNKAPKYFTKSIGSTDIMACKCNSWIEYRTRCKNSCDRKVIFGEYCPPTARGKYYLRIDA